MQHPASKQHWPQVKLLVCDLDNTLYDWVHYFVTCFYAMVTKIVEITGCDREQLLDDFREVHQRHHDSEHPFALLETNTIRTRFPNISSCDLMAVLDPAFKDFNSTRKKTLVLHEGVRNTLSQLTKAGIEVVAHTEATRHVVLARLELLGIGDLFTRVYCREASEIAHPCPARRVMPPPLLLQKMFELPVHKRKPNAEVLMTICATHNASPEETAYVGDSIARDILMARRAGAISIWAKYGTEHRPSEYEALVRVTHWTQDDVRREKELTLQAATIQPDAILNRGLSEITELILPKFL